MNETQTQTKRSTKTGTSLYNRANGERDEQDAAAETIWFNDREQTAAHWEMYLSIQKQQFQEKNCNIKRTSLP